MSVSYAGEILRLLAEAGFEAYIVGGAVRDFLRGSSPKDVDIATSASTDDVLRIAARMGWKTHQAGVSFGVIGITAADSCIEVATYRSERYGEDSHRPEAVEQVKTLAEDLARRDFTINAMAMDGESNIIDLYDGRRDLAAGIIRTVGDPELRFQEDGLRMFRAARFAAKLGFEIDPRIYTAARNNLRRVRGLSVERIRAELDKILLADEPDRGFEFLHVTGLIGESCTCREKGQKKYVPILPEVMDAAGWHLAKKAFRQIEPRLELRWAALLFSVRESTADIVERLRFPAAQASSIRWLVDHADAVPDAGKDMIPWLSELAAGYKTNDSFRHALDSLFKLIASYEHAAHSGAVRTSTIKTYTEHLLHTVPFFASQLPLTAGEIADALGQGPQVARFQAAMLRRIQAGELTDSREVLLEELATVYKENNR